MKIIITLISIVVFTVSYAQNVQSLSVFGGIEQKGFRDPNFFGGDYDITAPGTLVKPSFKFGATYLVGERLQVVAQLSNQALFNASSKTYFYDDQTFSSAMYRNDFEANQRVLEIGIRRHRKYAPYGPYYGLNLLISSTKINLIDTEVPELQNRELAAGSNRNFGAKAIVGATKMVSNKLFLDWGISYQFYPTNVGNLLSAGTTGNGDGKFYEIDANGVTYTEDFLSVMSNTLIDRCGRVAFYLNIGFNHINF